MDKKKAVSLPAENEEKMKVADIYIESERFLKMYASRAAAQKKISRKPEEVEKVVRRIFDYIKYINGLPEDTTIVLDHQLSDWPILNEFRDFIMPNTVRYEAGNRLFSDVLIHSEPYGGDVSQLSYSEYVDLLSEFRNFFKKDASDGKVMLDTLRVDKSFEDVRAVGACCWHKMYCHYNGDAFIPVPLKCLNVLVRNTYLNASDVEVVSDYLSRLFF
jgi:hypothetical protein